MIIPPDTDSPTDSGSVEPDGPAAGMAFDTLVAEYQLEIRLYLARKTGDATAADDLAQEVFMAAFNRFPDLTQSPRPMAWLKVVARNKAVDYLRRQARVSAVPGDEIEGLLAERYEDRVEEISDDPETLDALRQCLAALPDRSRNLVKANYFAGQSAQSIADQSGQADNTIRMALLRIRRTLARCVRSRLEPGGGEA